MKGSRVAKRYARALLDLADKGNEEKWGAELERLAAMVEAPELIDRLASPGVVRSIAAGGDGEDCRAPRISASRCARSRS